MPVVIGVLDMCVCVCVCVICVCACHSMFCCAQDLFSSGNTVDAIISQASHRA